MPFAYCSEKLFYNVRTLFFFKKDHRRIVPTFDRSADVDGEKEKYAAFLKLPLFLFVFQYLHSDQV